MTFNELLIAAANGDSTAAMAVGAICERLAVRIAEVENDFRVWQGCGGCSAAEIDQRARGFLDEEAAR